MKPVDTTPTNSHSSSAKAQSSSVELALPPTDGELLMRFSQHRDEDAFAKLVEKHGTLVWTLCWQILRHHQEREDAFQATFLILAKRAGTIRECDSLAGWLYRVAYRTALRARLDAQKKPTLGLGNDTPGDNQDQLASIQLQEQRSILLEELHALPQRYQMPLVLCYLQGKSRRAVAEELSWTLQTVKGRLARGRQLLRQRLIRRGVSLSVAMGAMTIPVKSALAAVTPQLVGSTLAGCKAWPSGSADVSSISPHALHLAQQGTTAMTIVSFAKPTMLVVALLTAATASVAIETTSRDQPTSQTSSSTLDLQANAALSEVTVPVKSDIAVALVAAEEEKLGIEAPTRSVQASKAEIPNADSSPKVELQKRIEAESNILELQLQAKELEIEALNHEGQEREMLMEQSRKYLLRAEAATLKDKLEQQRAMLEQLKQRPEDRDQATQAWPRSGEDDRNQLMRALALAQEAVAQSRETEVRMREEIKRAVREAQDQAYAASQQARAAAAQANSAAKGPSYIPSLADVPPPSSPTNSSFPGPTKMEPAAQKLQPGMRIQIEVMGAFPDKPIDGEFTIEPMGTVALGAAYGRVEVAGMTVLEAEEAIRGQLSEILTDPAVQVIGVANPPLFGGRGHAPEANPFSEF